MLVNIYCATLCSFSLHTLQHNFSFFTTQRYLLTGIKIMLLFQPITIKTPLGRELGCYNVEKQKKYFKIVFREARKSLLWLANLTIKNMPAFSKELQ